MKVVLALRQAQDDWLTKLRAAFPDVTFASAVTGEEQQREIADADVYVGLPTTEGFRAAKRLRWVHSMGMGIDRFLQVPELVTSDVALTNSPGPHTHPMADHALAVILALAHHLGELRDDQRAKRWEVGKYSDRVVEVNGSVLGLIGLGGLGRAVVQRALGFGMQPYAVDPHPTDVPAGMRAVWGLDKLDELCQLADWLVITAPLTAESQGIIDARRLALMKRGSYLVVISRGGIVDETALAEALRSGHLAGAGIDATAIEPLPADSPLWELDNLILSPHASALSQRLMAERRQIFQANLRRFLDGLPLAYVCDPRRGY